MYQCRECRTVRRNYRRWPKFCTNADCKRLAHPVVWCNSIPCEGTKCISSICGISQKVHGLCPDCAYKNTKRNYELKQSQIDILMRQNRKLRKTLKQAMFKTVAANDVVNG